MQATIGGATVTVETGSLAISDAIGQRTTCDFRVRDDIGANKFVANQPVTVTDDSGLVIFAGFIDRARRQKPGKTSLLLHTIKCKDMHYLADKRIAATSYANQTCGFMVNDLVTNYLAGEGVGTLANMCTANESNVETDTTGFAAVNSTITRDTTQHWQGAASLKIDATGASNDSYAAVGGDLGGMRLGMVAGGTYTFSGYVYVPTATGLTPDNAVRGLTLDLFYQVGTLGYVGTFSAKPTLTNTWQRLSLTVTLPLGTTEAFVRVYNGFLASGHPVYFDGLQLEQSPVANTWVVGQTSYVQAGPVVSSEIVNYKTVAAELDHLAQLATGFYWYIDFNKLLHFAVMGTATAPFTFDGSQAELSMPTTIESTSPLYRDAQYMLGATEITSAQTETRHGDGITRTFTLSFPVHQVPSDIHINAGAAQTIGILGVSTGKQWYWNKGSNVITQDPSGTLLISTDQFNITYVGEYKVVAYSTDAAKVITEQTIEGAGSGLNEDVQSDASLVSGTQAFQNANALIAKYGSAGQILTFRTRVAGLTAGQVMLVNLPSPWQMTGEQVLIESVRISDAGFWTWYDVTALEGPVNDTWVQYFQRLSDKQGFIDTTTGGLSTMVALANATNETWPWTESVTETVTACAIFTITFPKVLC